MLAAGRKGVRDGKDGPTAAALAVLPVSPKGPRALPPGPEGCEPEGPREFLCLEWGHGDPVPESMAASLRPLYPTVSET